MTSSTIDPFTRIKGYERTPTSKPQTMSDVFPIRTPKYATLVKTVVIENRTRYDMVSWDNMCIPQIIPKLTVASPEVVRVEISVKPCSITQTDYLGMHELMAHVPPDMIDHIDRTIKGQDLRYSNTASPGAIYFYWDIPVSVLEQSPNGVYIDVLGIVLRLKKYHDVHPIVPANHVPTNIQLTGEGIMATFNKVDRYITGIWLNLKGNITWHLCQNQNDPTQPEGLIIQSNGKERTFSIDELSANGFYMSELDAASARSDSASEINAAQKAYQQQVDKEYERKLKEEQTYYDRRQREDLLAREIENKEYERRIKEAEREAKEAKDKLQHHKEERSYQDQRSDKNMANSAAKRSSFITIAQGLFGLLITGPKGIETVVKLYRELAGD